MSHRAAVSSIVPQIWLVLMERTEMKLTTLMLIWMSLAGSSLLVGVLIYPWHNLPDNGSVEEKHLATYRTIRKNNDDLFRIGDKYPSIVGKFTEAAEFLKSPMFYIHLVHFALGNCMITLTINVANDIMRKLEPEDLEGMQQSCLVGIWKVSFVAPQTDNQRKFEIMRVVITVVWGPVIGFFTDLYAKSISGGAKDAKTVHLPVIANQTIFTIIIGCTLSGAAQKSVMWLLFAALACGMSNIYIVETLGQFVLQTMILTSYRYTTQLSEPYAGCYFCFCGADRHILAYT